MNAAGRLARLLDDPRLFDVAQLVTCGTQARTRRLIREALALRPGERLLDAGCGTGTFADLATGPYLGIDINPRYLAHARRTQGKGSGHPEREFLVEDLTGPAFARRRGSFPAAMLINVLHHLSDAQGATVLAALARLTKGRLVVVDMDPFPPSAVSGWLGRTLDRGAHLRPLAAQVRQVGTSFRIVRYRRFYSGPWGHTLLVCAPKSVRA